MVDGLTSVAVNHLYFTFVVEGSIQSIKISVNH